MFQVVQPPRLLGIRHLEKTKKSGIFRRVLVLFQTVLKIAGKEKVRRLVEIERPKNEPRSHLTHLHISAHPTTHVSLKFSILTFPVSAVHISLIIPCKNVIKTCMQTSDKLFNDCRRTFWNNKQLSEECAYSSARVIILAVSVIFLLLNTREVVDVIFHRLLDYIVSSQFKYALLDRFKEHPTSCLKRKIVLCLVRPRDYKKEKQNSLATRFDCNTRCRYAPHGIVRSVPGARFLSHRRHKDLVRAGL